MKVGIDFMTGHLKNYKRGTLCLPALQELFPQLDFVYGMKFLLNISDIKSDEAVEVGLVYPQKCCSYLRWIVLKNELTLQQVLENPDLEREILAGIFINTWTDGNVYAIMRRFFGKSATSAIE